MKIAIDAMGGDYAPQEIVRGAIDACREFGVNIVLVGDEEKIHRELGDLAPDKLGLEIHASKTVITMDEHPAHAVRQKPDSSIVMANRLVKEGKAEAIISAGNTGAAMTASLLTLGRIDGVQRPAIASPMPTRKGVSIVLDAGANADCEPEYLLQFAMMGSVYAEKVFGVKNPRVGLLSIGEEETKGNKLTLKTYELLKKSSVNFIGNIEGQDVHRGDCDVIVCDGFVGNIVLKLSEGLASTMFGLTKEAFKTNVFSSLGGLMAKGSLKKTFSRLDYTEYGGAPLLGLKGISLISHGRSNAKAIKNAVKAAMKACREGVVDKIATSVNFQEG